MSERPLFPESVTNHVDEYSALLSEAGFGRIPWGGVKPSEQVEGPEKERGRAVA